MKIIDIARICHEANRAFCTTTGGESHPAWSAASDAQKSSILAGVMFRAQFPSAPASAQHDQWMAHKLSLGWKHGEKKDDEKKTHPNLVPFESLPEQEQLKDALFAQITLTLLPYVELTASWSGDDGNNHHGTVIEINGGQMNVACFDGKVRAVAADQVTVNYA